MNWTNAVSNCEAKNSSLVQISDDTTNAQIRNMLSDGTEVWIDLHRDVSWVWFDSGIIHSSPNWKAGQVQNATGQYFCAAIWLEDGTLTQESCDELNPFICTGMTDKEPISETFGSFGELLCLCCSTSPIQ